MNMLSENMLSETINYTSEVSDVTAFSAAFSRKKRMIRYEQLRQHPFLCHVGVYNMAYCLDDGQAMKKLYLGSTLSPY